MPGERARRLTDALPRVALAAGLVVVGVRAAEGEPWLAVPLVYLAVVSGELCRVDLAELRLPNALVVPGLASAVAGVACTGLSERDAMVTAAGWGVGYASVLLVPALAGEAGMGDVKLAMVLGLLLGLIGPWCAILGSLSPFVAAGVVALGAGVWPGARRGDQLAFGPFMLGGFWAAVAVAPAL